MFALIWLVLLVGIVNSILANTTTDRNSTKIVIVGAGAAGMSAAAKLLENGYNNIIILEAENRIGGRVHSVPFGKGYADLGAQWCHGQDGNVVYEMVKKYFEFGETSFSHEKSHFYRSDGKLVDQEKCSRLLNVSEIIMGDFVDMGRFNGSYGEFFHHRFDSALQKTGFEDIDKELANQIVQLSHTEINTFYASETWFEISTRLNAYGDDEGNKQLTWKEHGYKTVFDFITKKRPDPSKEINVGDKIRLNKEVTNIDWNSNEVTINCADGSEYQADHVIVTVSLGVLKMHHSTLFTPQLPDKKIHAITNTGFGTLGKIFIAYEEPFWPTDINDWVAYLFLWKQEDLDSINGTDKEWLKDVIGFIRVDAQPNVISALVAGTKIKQFEEISDNQMIDDCIWLLEKFLGKSLPPPIRMLRSRWLTNKNFLGSYSFPSMDTQTHNVVPGKDLAESLYGNYKKPVVLFAGEATHEYFSGYVHGAVASGWRAVDEILDYYKSTNEN